MFLLPLICVDRVLAKHLDQPEVQPAYSIFKTEDLESQIVSIYQGCYYFYLIVAQAKLQTDITDLRSAAHARTAARDAAALADVSMDMQPDVIEGSL